MRFATDSGAYEIDSVPSQPQVAHCHAFFVPKDLRGQGRAHAMKTHQNMMLAALGYDFATCTVCSSNAAQKRVLTRAGWARLASFTSSKTGEEVELWGWAVAQTRALEGRVSGGNATTAGRLLDGVLHDDHPTAPV